jgi:hypothetical protein
MLLGKDDAIIEPTAVANPVDSKIETMKWTDIFNWIGDNSKMLDANEMNKIYHTNPNILQPTEVVEMAFAGRHVYYQAFNFL